MRGHTTEFIFKDLDFFSARLDNGGVRIGYVGGPMVDLPSGHRFFNECCAVRNAAEVEAMTDKLIDLGVLKAY